MNLINRTHQNLTSEKTSQESGQNTILIVDDSEPNRLVLQDNVLTLGHRPLLAENGVEALAMIQEKRPDLVLLDVMMPQMDGYQVLERLKSDASLRHIPVIMISAVSDMESLVKCIQQGAIDYLVKPFNPTLLKTRINAGLANKQLHDQQEKYRKKIEEYNTQLEEKVRERTRELEETRLEVVHRLGRAAEYRDNETSMHIHRMSNYCARIGKELGVSEKECKLLLLASPMHDIGKIGIPDGILLKSGPLTDEEWQIMKAHPAIGGDILAGGKSLLIKMAEIIARTHHEKWDGSGYPIGLKHDQIPLVGRIAAICDVFDALTSKRPYKKAFPLEKSMQYIEEQSGKHFDPALVEIFIKVLPDLLEIKKKFSEKKETPERPNP